MQERLGADGIQGNAEESAALPAVSNTMEELS